MQTLHIQFFSNRKTSEIFQTITAKQRCCTTISSYRYSPYFQRECHSSPSFRSFVFIVSFFFTVICKRHSNNRSQLFFHNLISICHFFNPKREFFLWLLHFLQGGWRGPESSICFSQCICSFSLFVYDFCQEISVSPNMYSLFV